MRFSGAAGLALLAASSACAGPRVHTAFEASYRSARTVALVEPAVNVDEIGALDLRRPHPGWTSAARENVARGVAAALESRGFAVVRPAPAGKDAALQNDLVTRYLGVEPALVKAQHWPDHGFTKGPFEFSIGPVNYHLAEWGADILALVSGSDEISDAVRAVEQTFFRKDATWGRAALNVALVDRSGTVVWFFGTEARESIDLRKAGDAASLAATVLADLPRR